jgi:V/A-type H+/Na+-transporting ATPase subunit C
MDDFDYGNARLRVMKSRLLTRQELESLAEADTLKSLILSLAKTSYRKSIEVALVRSSGMDSIAKALRDDLIENIGKIPNFYQGSCGEMVAIVLRSYDIHNLKAILRGLSQNVPSSEIQRSLLPVGELTGGMLEELSLAAEPRAAIDLLASMSSPFAQPLLELRSSYPGADTSAMELALERWSYRRAKSYLENENLGGSLLAKALKLEADLTNLLTVLRFSESPAERRLMREWLGGEDLERLLLGPGSLPFDRLVQAGMQDTLEAAIDIFTGTPYEEPLRAGFKDYSRSRRLSELERQLRRFRLRWMSNQIVSDPLGIGVVMGYCSLKVNEVNNLSWIAQGINMGLKAQAIRENLEHPA